MNRNLLFRASFAVLLVGVAGFFFYLYLNDALPGRESGRAGKLEISDRREGEDIETGGADQAQDIKDKEPRNKTEALLNNTTELAATAAAPGSVTKQQISKILNYEASVVDSYKELAIEGEMSYEAAIKNISIWNQVCSVSDEKIHEIYLEPRESNSSNSIVDRIEELCEGFSGDVKGEIDDLAHAEMITHWEETWMTEVRSSLDDFGWDAAFERAIDQLSRSLHRFNYALALDTVGFLGFSSTLYDEPRSELKYSYLSSDIRVIFSVTAKLFCEQLGGCNGQHPITLQLCLQFNERRCSNPVSITNAIDQILTGLEHKEFLEMHFGLRTAISRQRN